MFATKSLVEDTDFLQEYADPKRFAIIPDFDAGVVNIFPRFAPRPVSPKFIQSFPLDGDGFVRAFIWCSHQAVRPLDFPA